MTGMQTMSGAVSPLKEVPAFIKVLTSFSNPFMGILAGIAFTAVLQSASASVGILQALSMTGAISFAVAFPVTMGIGVGAACPVLLSSIGTNKNGQRTALVYLLNDLFGMIIGSILFYTANAIVGGFSILSLTMTPMTIALLNTVYRMINVAILFPFVKLIEKLVFFLIKDSGDDMEEQVDFDRLEEKFLANPEIAIEQSHLTITGMSEKVESNFDRALRLLNGKEAYDEARFKRVGEKEVLIDKYEDKLGSYLMKITQSDLSVEQSRETNKFLRAIGDFERIGDHACNLAKIAKELNENKIQFSDDACKELAMLYGASDEIVKNSVKAFVENDLTIAGLIEPLRQYITTMCREMKSRHIARLQQGKCDIPTGFPFNDILTNLDRVAAHCSNIAVAMIELQSDDFDSRKYVKSIAQMRNEEYKANFTFYAAKYPLPEFEGSIDLTMESLFGDN